MPDLKTKIYDVLKTPQILSFATVTTDGAPWVRYVFGSAAEDLTISFCTGVGSRKAAHVQANPEVHITCGIKDLNRIESYLQIQGTAEISREEELRRRKWNDRLKMYWSGPDDPGYGVCTVTPRRVEYMALPMNEPEVWEG